MTHDMDGTAPSVHDAVVAALLPLVLAILRDPRFIEAARALALSPPAAPQEPPRLLSKTDLAKRLGISRSTVDRLTREGLPVAAHVGDSRRYDLPECRAWLASRGKRPTRAKIKMSDDIDVSDIAAAAGLRRARP